MVAFFRSSVFASAFLAAFMASSFSPCFAYDAKRGNYFVDADRLPTPTNGQRFFNPTGPAPYPKREPKRTLVDLHSHLFQHGLGIASSGDFKDEALWADWQSKFTNKVNGEGLEASGLGLVVVALYGHPILSLPAKESVRNQIRMAHEFVKQHPSWVIARNNEEAKNAYAAGKRVMVLSLEGAGGILESESDIHEFIDRGGISIVTFSHLTDDNLSGASLMKGYQGLANPLAAVKATLNGKQGCRGENINDNGLTKEGRVIAEALIRRGVWLDLSHSSEATTRALSQLMDAAKQPLLYTHTGLRKYHPAERELSEAQLRRIAESGGVVGIVTGESVIGKTPIPAANCPPQCKGRCEGGVFALAAQYNEMANVVGRKNVFLGTDLNGAMDHLKPSGPGCALGSNIDRQGFANVSQYAELWQDLGEAGAVSTDNEVNGVENFLEAWGKVKSKK